MDARTHRARTGMRQARTPQDFRRSRQSHARHSDPRVDDGGVHRGDSLRVHREEHANARNARCERGDADRGWYGSPKASFSRVDTSQAPDTLIIRGIFGDTRGLQVWSRDMISTASVGDGALHEGQKRHMAGAFDCNRQPTMHLCR